MHEARAKGRPYTIVFVGVNGVGKSTNLAKICYWLLQNDVKVSGRSDVRANFSLVHNCWLITGRARLRPLMVHDM